MNKEKNSASIGLLGSRKWIKNKIKESLPLIAVTLFISLAFLIISQTIVYDTMKYEIEVLEEKLEKEKIILGNKGIFEQGFMNRRR